MTLTSNEVCADKNECILTQMPVSLVLYTGKYRFWSSKTRISILILTYLLVTLANHLNAILTSAYLNEDYVISNYYCED